MDEKIVKKVVVMFCVLKKEKRGRKVSSLGVFSDVYLTIKRYVVPKPLIIHTSVGGDLLVEGNVVMEEVRPFFNGPT